MVDSEGRASLYPCVYSSKQCRQPVVLLKRGCNKNHDHLHHACQCFFRGGYYELSYDSRLFVDFTHTHKVDWNISAKNSASMYVLYQLLIHGNYMEFYATGVVCVFCCFVNGVTVCFSYVLFCEWETSIDRASGL